MENLLGLLRVHIRRGVNLAVRDVRSSDPYVVLRMGKQVINHLSLSLSDTNPEKPRVLPQNFDLYISNSYANLVNPKHKILSGFFSISRNLISFSNSLISFSCFCPIV